MHTEVIQKQHSLGLGYFSGTYSQGIRLEGQLSPKFVPPPLKNQTPFYQLSFCDMHSNVSSCHSQNNNNNNNNNNNKSDNSKPRRNMGRPLQGRGAIAVQF